MSNHYEFMYCKLFIIRKKPLNLVIDYSKRFSSFSIFINFFSPFQNVLLRSKKSVQNYCTFFDKPEKSYSPFSELKPIDVPHAFASIGTTLSRRPAE